MEEYPLPSATLAKPQQQQPTRSKRKGKKEKQDNDDMPPLEKKNAQTFRLVHGSGGNNAWAPMGNHREFQGYVAKSGHIEYIGKKGEYENDDEYDEEGEGEGYDDGEEYNYGESDSQRFADADDYSQADVQKELYKYRSKKQKTDNAFSEELLMFPDDGYDYTQHMRAPGTGVFIPIDVDYFKKIAKAKKKKGDTLDDEPAILASHDVDDIEDRDIDAQLYNEVPESEVQAAGELDDDFIIQANGGELIEDESKLEDPMARRARSAAERRLVFGGDEAADYDDYEIEEWEEEDEEYDYDKDPSELEKAFENTLNLYDDEDIGELDPEHPDVQGKEDINAFEGMILQIHKEEVRPKNRRPKYVAPIRADNDEPAPVDEGEDRPVYNDDDLEYVEVEGKLEDKWDCQSILSTYSNTENHPKLITEKSKKPAAQIKLSNKTGMPLGVLPTKAPKKEIEEDDGPAENLGKARSENETPEQKKERKKQQKEAKRFAREEKKAYKEAFKHEEIRQSNVIKSGATAKRVVVKY